LVKKVLAFLFPDTAPDKAAMGKTPIPSQIIEAAKRSEARIGGAENHATDAGGQKSSGAHETGLQGGIEGTLPKTP